MYHLMIQIVLAGLLSSMRIVLLCCMLSGKSYTGAAFGGNRKLTSVKKFPHILKKK